MTELKQIIVPLALFIFVSIVVVIVASLIMKYLNRRLALETVRNTLSSDAKVDPLLIEAIVKEPQKSNADLRKGIFLIVLTLAMVIFAFVIADLVSINVFKSVIGISIFPGLIGTTYIAFYFLEHKKTVEE